MYRIPFVWEGNEHWDEEIDWKSGIKVYKLKPKLHPSYRHIKGVVFCWEHIFCCSLKPAKTKYLYPHFISSAHKNYKASVDLNGFLYLIQRQLYILLVRMANFYGQKSFLWVMIKILVFVLYRGICH